MGNELDIIGIGFDKSGKLVAYSKDGIYVDGKFLALSEAIEQRKKAVGREGK